MYGGSGQKKLSMKRLAAFLKGALDVAERNDGVHFLDINSVPSDGGKSFVEMFKSLNRRKRQREGRKGHSECSTEPS